MLDITIFVMILRKKTYTRIRSPNYCSIVLCAIHYAILTDLACVAYRLLAAPWEVYEHVSDHIKGIEDNTGCIRLQINFVCCSDIEWYSKSCYKSRTLI